jgi:large subunit ribosomal protein L23
LASSDRPVYVFEVAGSANKNQVALAVKEAYKVTPVQVNMINLKPKTVFSRGKYGKRSGIKKAVVFLKKGDKIEFV